MPTLNFALKQCKFCRHSAYGNEFPFIYWFCQQSKARSSWTKRKQWGQWYFEGSKEKFDITIPMEKWFVLKKFIYSEKTTKLWEIFTLLLTGTTLDKSKVKISQSFVALTEYMNFKMVIKSNLMQINCQNLFNLCHFAILPFSI